MSEYSPPTELIKEARALTRELQQIDLNDGGGGNTGEGGNTGGGNTGGGNTGTGGSRPTASASSALIAVAGLAGTAYFFMSDQE